MWYVKYRNNTRYGWRPVRFKTAQAGPLYAAFRMALELHKTGWKEIHITTKAN